MKRYILLAALALPAVAFAADQPDAQNAPKPNEPAVNEPNQQQQQGQQQIEPQANAPAERRPAEREPAPRARLSDNPASNPIVRQGNLFTNRQGVAPNGTTDWDTPSRGRFSEEGQDDTPPGRQNLPGVATNPRDLRR